jgi:hypothetical protein
VECPKGSYCIAKSMLPLVCKSCKVGEGLVAACSVDADTQCELCNDGEFSSGGVSKCGPCKTNEISNTAKSACIPCKECAVGQGIISFCSGNTDTRCSPCVAGQFSPGGTSTCQWCPPGSFCSLGASAPRPCLKGSFCPNVTFIQGFPVWGTSEKPCMSGNYCPRGRSEPIPCAHGATCTIPASPELVLEPAMFDLIESEVGGSIQYHLSLSAQPNASVTVKIKLLIKSEECYAYNESSKFKLEGRMEFEFGSDNYSIPQIVVSHFLYNHFL